MNRANLSRFLEEFEISVALFELLERGGGPPSRGVLGGLFINYRIIAARDGAMNIFHFGCSLETIKKQLPACPRLAQKTDALTRNELAHGSWGELHYGAKGITEIARFATRPHLMEQLDRSYTKKELSRVVDEMKDTARTLWDAVRPLWSAKVLRFHAKCEARNRLAQKKPPA